MIYNVLLCCTLSGMPVGVKFPVLAKEFAGTLHHASTSSELVCVCIRNSRDPALPSAGRERRELSSFLHMRIIWPDNRRLAEIEGMCQESVGGEEGGLVEAISNSDQPTAMTQA